MSIFTKDIPLISQSHQFQEWLRQNPDKAERAVQYRESVVLEFLRARRLSPNFDPNVYQAISNGTYNPKDAVPKIEVPIPVVPIPIPLVCTFSPPYLTNQYSIGPGNGEYPELFDFTPGSGNSTYFRLDPLDPGDIPAGGVIINFTGFSDSALVFKRNAGEIDLSQDVNYYTQMNPGSEPYGPYNIELTGVDISPHMGDTPQVIDFVVYHLGTNPTLLFNIYIQCESA